MFKKVYNFFNFEEEEEDKKVKFIYRPKTFSEYIGQKNVKRILENYIRGINERELVFPHTIIHGPPGFGKTTLAKIIANELQVNWTENIASQMKEIDKVLAAINSLDGGLLFLDEIHSMSREEVERLYPIMEDFQFGGTALEPFTLVGATTELGEILKNRRPFYDRFKIILELEDYTLIDLIKMGSQYKSRMFPNDGLNSSNYRILAENCRGTPRTLIRLLEATIYFRGDIDEVLKCFGILYKGFTLKDLKVLKYLANEKIVGLQGLASYLGTSTENYLYEIEPYLVKNGLISRTPRGRRITEIGVKLAKELDEMR
ncbi:hypothetical protein LCGC14_2213690 [marine sediment metagenome]|uniref:AAA+ ATPase domain-containing protein n=1 Tax=marine sediment metagenome TaxID=412755 RepID=A0A0F9G8M6_9ZZZZ